jgi:UDP-N-acetyl-D-glucosamine dehydrogenase
VSPWLGNVSSGESFLGYSPERIDPNNALFGLRNTPKLVGGSTPACTEAMRSLYESIVDEVVVVSAPTVAEATKMFENAYRLVNISLVNEFAIFCREMNISVWEVIEAASTKPFGFQAFWPGLGAGGHCIPLTPLYLAWKARERDAPLQTVEVARDVNNRMPEHVARQVSDVLNRDGLSLNGARVLMLGVAYKAELSDTRNSPASMLIQHLLGKGAEVLYHDPFVPQVQLGAVQLKSVESLDQELDDADIVIVVTDHSWYDWDGIESTARRILDTRGVFRNLRSSKVTML